MNNAFIAATAKYYAERQVPSTTNPAPAAACQRCGGWTNHGGMSQHYHSTEPVYGRIGCTCNK